MVFVLLQKKVFWVCFLTDAMVKEKNMNTIIPIAMDMKDYLLFFLTKRIRWEILLK
jgi:hypothetical protein